MQLFVGAELYFLEIVVGYTHLPASDNSKKITIADSVQNSNKDENSSSDPKNKIKIQLI